MWKSVESWGKWQFNSQPNRFNSLHSRGGQLHDHNQEGYYVILCGSLAGRASVYSEQSINHKAASIFVIRYADHEMPTPRVITFIRRSVKQIHSIGFTVIRKIVGGGGGHTFGGLLLIILFLHGYRCNSVQFEGLKVSKC